MLSNRSFLLRQALLLTLSLVGLLYVFPVGGSLDQAFIQPWVDLHGGFPHRNDWALAVLNHRYIKNIVIGVYVHYIAAWICSFKYPHLKARKFEFGYFIVVALLSTAIIGLLKSQSAHACPWNMTVATAQGFSWDFSARQGHCFPGGHAATGFALITGYFVYRIHRPARAYFFLSAGLILGFAFGWAQMMRGAHFLSHNLWTAWFIWAFNTVIYTFGCRYLPTEKIKTAYKHFEWI
ncbi:phosphatase PAP2 family protein [Acinetobacter sp. ANC 5033]|uniref:phosphatase PAP2 family protein n=1 Tax=Acinetobacter amyesii TaxID=2942470 RepID=UPI00201B9092|nr:phosphatase PAP2 family protein [Acinetobacter amyesii]MCL6236921.1 phosphatase PAP2 family protein [Acinetobacter amyesii]